MTRKRSRPVIAAYPNARGLAYVVVEQGELLDWGAIDAPLNRRVEISLRRLEVVLHRYQPDAVVVRDVSRQQSKRLLHFVGSIAKLAMRRDIRLIRISREQVRSSFADQIAMPTRYAIAQEIAENIPALRPLLPPKRKIWIGESRRMGLFDATALALTFGQVASSSAK